MIETSNQFILISNMTDMIRFLHLFFEEENDERHTVLKWFVEYACLLTLDKRAKDLDKAEACITFLDEPTGYVAKALHHLLENDIVLHPFIMPIRFYDNSKITAINQITPHIRF
jgi:hypothetical protein